MPTDLPPDYKPNPIPDPADPAVPGSEPAFPPEPGSDSRDPSGISGGRGNDVVDPPGWAVPPLGPNDDPAGVPLPAGTPTF